MLLSFTLQRIYILVALGWTKCGNGQVTQWLDVCTAEEYQNYRTMFCRDTFFVSTVAFDPLYPKTNASITLIVRPSQDLASTFGQRQLVDISLPDFVPLGPINRQDGAYRDLSVVANNPTVVGQDPSTTYNTYANPLFQTTGLYGLASGVLRLVVYASQTIRKDTDTEVRICCMRLPASSPMNNVDFRISAPTALAGAPIRILDEPIKRSPYLDPGYQWQFLMVEFDPPKSMDVTVISLTLRSANDLSNRCRIILHLPTILRVTGSSGVIGFKTAGVGGGTDWMLFEGNALWDNTAHTITFFLRQGAVLAAGRSVTLRTNPGDFKLPVDIEANWPNIMVESRSQDNIDEITRATAVRQSARVPHVRNFTYSELRYLDKTPGAVTDVELVFQTNRPMFAGTVIYMRLAGFQSNVLEVPIVGENKFFFAGHIARFRLPENEVELRLNRSLYSDERNISVVMRGLILPVALYADDTSLRIWNSDAFSIRQPIDKSPALGGLKTFNRSQITFDPAEPRMPANITIIILPSIFFYQGDRIILHLYGFICTLSDIPLQGTGASLIEGATAHWIGQEHVLILTVAQNKVITNIEPLIVTIARETNFRLPDKLARNDGILRIESQGALIKKETMKKVPALGSEKLVIDSRIEFSPTSDLGILSGSIARISISLTLNCDVLPNSTVFIKLGGLKHITNNQPSSGDITLVGANAPLFVGSIGQWDQDSCILSLQIVHNVQIRSGEQIRFSIDRLQKFLLPYAMYPNDPSFKLEIPQAGIAQQQFRFSTRVSQDTKTFIMSEICYNDCGSFVYLNVVAPPVVDLTLRFQSNVDIPGGTIVRLTLPNFESPERQLRISGPVQPFTGEQYIYSRMPYGKWNQLNYTFDLEVPPGYELDRTKRIVLRVLRENSGGFRLPRTPLQPNDPSITIQTLQNQIIFSEGIKISPQVVARTFITSEFQYQPAVSGSPFLLTMRLEPTVNITFRNAINIELPGFTNALSKNNIHITGPARDRITDSMGQWNETTSTLRLTIPFGQQIDTFTVLDFRIEESQGFLLPGELDSNDTRLRISSEGGNIKSEPIKTSPMVGDGPFTRHMYCMMQYERGTRTEFPNCTGAIDCDPPLTDPCSNEELQRCGCTQITNEKFPLRVFGFNLLITDQISFLPQNMLCGSRSSSPVLSDFALPTLTQMSDARGELKYHNISSIATGHFRVCVTHAGRVFDVGKLIVRPSCRSPLVMVDGTCVEHCPKTKIPIAGDCLRDPVAAEPMDSQALMLEVCMRESSVGGSYLVARRSSDAEKRYFIYRYTYELSRLLNTDPTRIDVVSLSNGSVMVSTIFKTVGNSEAIAASTERSPMGLISLFRALQSDTSSQMYTSSFFREVCRTQPQKTVNVRKCPDGQYRVVCSYVAPGLSPGVWTSIFLLGVIGQALLLGLLCVCAWQVDTDVTGEVTKELLDQIRRDPLSVDPKQREEYALSWLEGRYMGERWQQARQGQMLALAN